MYVIDYTMNNDTEDLFIFLFFSPVSPVYLCSLLPAKQRCNLFRHFTSHANLLKKTFFSLTVSVSATN